MTLNTQESRIVSHVEAHSKIWSDWIRQLVAIPTVNPYSGDSDNIGEAEGQEWMAEQLSSMGAGVRNVPVSPNVYRKAGVNASENRSWKRRDTAVLLPSKSR